ncbi:MAG: nucleotide sugar dehydrogenase [Cytophagaceae bacterium]|nr:nucleotide sugar dehydrogenase [Gemmatimonadaceae bacterium]
MKEQLLNRIKDRTAVVGVVGLGYVGLPLAMEFAKAGFKVVGYDVSERAVQSLMAGHSHIQDVPTEDVAEQVRLGRFVATTEEARLRDCDAISIAVPTPLSKSRDPDMSYVEAATLAIARNCRAGMLIVLESTTYPGTTREVLQPRIEEKGLVVGQDVFLAFSPERVDPGNPTWHTKNTPKVVGGVTPNCTEVASALYSACIDTVVPVASAEVAELVKLMENTFRAVNIGLVNEMAIVCDKLGVDVWEVINAAATKPFGYMKFTPGPGIGGHCIPLDPLYLAWKMRTLNYRTRFIDLASDINSEMPEYVVRKVARALNDDQKSVKGARVLVLGVAYKKDIDDMRESPALEVMRMLEERGAIVVYHDPWVKSFREHGVTHEGVALTNERLQQSDVVVIVTDHTSVDYQAVADHAPLIMDARNAMSRTTVSKARVVPLSAPS